MFVYIHSDACMQVTMDGIAIKATMVSLIILYLIRMDWSYLRCGKEKYPRTNFLKT